MVWKKELSLFGIVKSSCSFKIILKNSSVILFLIYIAELIIFYSFLFFFSRYTAMDTLDLKELISKKKKKIPSQISLKIVLFLDLRIRRYNRSQSYMEEFSSCMQEFFLFIIHKNQQIINFYSICLSFYIFTFIEHCQKSQLLVV